MKTSGFKLDYFKKIILYLILDYILKGWIDLMYISLDPPKEHL